MQPISLRLHFEDWAGQGRIWRASPHHTRPSEYKVPDRSIIKHHALPRPDRVMKPDWGKSDWRDGCLSNGDLDSDLAGRGTSASIVLLIAPEKDEQTPLRLPALPQQQICMSFSISFGEENLAGECL